MAPLLLTNLQPQLLPHQLLLVISLTPVVLAVAAQVDADKVALVVAAQADVVKVVHVAAVTTSVRTTSQMMESTRKSSSSTAVLRL